MSVINHACYSVSCDRCKNDFQPHDFTEHFSSEAEALDEAESYDWGRLSDDRLVCDSCIETLLATGEIEEIDEIDANNVDGPAYRVIAPASQQKQCENCGHAAHGHAEHLADPVALRDCSNCSCAAELRELADEPSPAPDLKDVLTDDFGQPVRECHCPDRPAEQAPVPQPELSNPARQLLMFGLIMVTDRMASWSEEFDADGQRAMAELRALAAPARRCGCAYLDERLRPCEPCKYADLNSQLGVALTEARAAAGQVPAPQCSGVETEPNRCTCSCEGCQYNCGAHNPAPQPETVPGQLQPRRERCPGCRDGAPGRECWRCDHEEGTRR